MYYGDTELLYPYSQNFSQDAHHLDLLQLCHSHQSQSPMRCDISEYDMGLEEAGGGMSIDPMTTAAISMMSCVDHVMPAEGDMESGFPKSVSSGCLRSMEDWIGACTMKVGFQELSLSSELDFGMRRAFSDGDIKALIHPPQQQQRPAVCTPEDRLQKLSRYRNKKSKRNFRRKIKYTCRKALADSQPRIRGRFAKTQH